VHDVNTLVTPASEEKACLERLKLDLPASRHMLKVTVPTVNHSDPITLIFPTPLPVGQTSIG
jgi:hypothetical protein